MALLSVAKLDALGNDFIVMLAWETNRGSSPARARYLCDRRRGLGADGVLSVLPPRAGGDLRMELVNGDGSVAEMSGNGIRCLALAVLDWGLVAGPGVAVETACGLRRVLFEEVNLAGEAVQIAAEMGPVAVGAELASPLWGSRASLATVGNPHMVVIGESARGADVSAIGPRLEVSRAGGVNVELVSVDCLHGGLDLTVWERGAGATRACGTGSCAAAAVARSWGLVSDRVPVRNPGGLLEVQLSGEDRMAPQAVLAGPVRRIAQLQLDPAKLPA